MARRVRIIGAGRAGGSLALALAGRGWELRPSLGRGDDLAGAAQDVDLLVIATPDAAIAPVAASVAAVPDTVVAHLAGSLGLDVLGAHPRRAALHPLVSMPDPQRGAAALAGAWFAVAGDPLVDEVVRALDGRSFAIADADRATYHAAAAVASNHLVALLGQVERLARSVGAAPEAFWALADQSLANVVASGAAAALTGPVARGDWATVVRHLEALPVGERPAYLALAAEARRLVADDGLPPEVLAFAPRPTAG